MVNTIFNTGVDYRRAPLPLGHVDEHWTLLSGPGISGHDLPVYVMDPIPVGYFSTSDSRWVWFDKAGTATFSVQPYVFRQRFELAFDPRLLLAQISIRWGADNWGHVTINGVSPAWSGEISLPPGVVPNNFGNPHDLTMTSQPQSAFNVQFGNVQEGVNYLEISVFNARPVSPHNPSGFNVTGSGITLVRRPEINRPPQPVL